MNLTDKIKNLGGRIKEAALEKPFLVSLGAYVASRAVDCATTYNNFGLQHVGLEHERNDALRELMFYHGVFEGLAIHEAEVIPLAAAACLAMNTLTNAIDRRASKPFFTGKLKYVQPANALLVSLAAYEVYISAMNVINLVRGFP